MPTVDDLVISLTIKENSRLGRLQKQLDAIVGKKGARVGFGLGALGNIPADIAQIKKQMQWLRPSVLPTKESPVQLRRVAGSILKDLEDNMSSIVSKIMTVKPQYFKTLKDELGALTDEELKSSLESSLNQVRETVSDIFKGTSILAPHKQEEVVHTLDRLIAEALSGREVGLEFWRAIGKFTPEEIWKQKLLKIISEAGAKGIPEKGLYRVKPEALLLPEIQKFFGFGGGGAKYPKGVEEFINRVEREFKTGGTITRTVSADIEDWMALNKIAKIIGSKINVDDVAFKLQEIREKEGEERAKELIEEIKKTFGAGGLNREALEKILGRDLFKLVSPETKEELDKLVKDVYSWSETATMGAKRIDIEVENIKSLIEDLGINVPQDITMQFGLELKKIINRKDIDQLLMYMSYYKENVVLIGEQIATGVREYAKSLGLEKFLSVVPNLRKLEEKYGISKPIISAESEEFLEQLEELTNEIEENTELIKNWLENPESITGEEKEKLFEYLRGFAHRLGVNPNSVDLPYWTDRVMDEISKLSEATEEQSIKDKLDQIKQSITSLIQENKQMGLDLEGLQGFLYGIPSFMAGTESPGIYKTLVDLTRKEAKTPEGKALGEQIKSMQESENIMLEQYKNFPKLITEGLEDISRDIKENEETKTLSRKVEELKTIIIRYNKELLTNLKKGQRVTEPPKTDGFPEG